MAQVHLTMSVDSEIKQQMDRYCVLSGMSQERVLAEMTSMWQKLIYVPWTEFFEKEEQRRRAKEALRLQHEKAERGEVPEMTMDEIDSIIETVRAERLAKEKKQ